MTDTKNDIADNFGKLSIDATDHLRLVQFVQTNYGINLSQKKHLIESRLGTTIRAKGFTTFRDYVDYILKTNNQQDLEILLNKLTTNHTFFMREKSHFDLFRDTILPQLEQTKKNKVLSIWSAGCSSGQEPYTLSMILMDYFGAKASSWDTRILATDISMKALMAAKQAQYSDEDISSLPKDWQKNYVAKADNDHYTFIPKIKDNVIFREFNLMNPIRFKIPFDVIFCRNVMIYFDQPTKDQLIQRFYQVTNPNGYLLIGHSETLSKENCPYAYLMPATYQKK